MFLAKSVEDKENWCYNLELACRMFGEENEIEVFDPLLPSTQILLTSNRA